MSASKNIAISLSYPIVNNGHEVAVPLKANIPMEWAGGGLPLPSIEEVVKIYESRKRKSLDIADMLKRPVFFKGELLSSDQTTILRGMVRNKYGKGDNKLNTSTAVHTSPASPTVTLDYFKQQCLDSKVGRYCFLSPADIEVITGRAEGTVLNDYRKGLIRAMNPGEKYPKFDYPEVHAYLVRVKWVKI